MSRKYQGLIALNTKSIEGTIDDLVASITKELEAEGATIDKLEQLGRRQFAYPSNHLESAHYLDYRFTSEPAAINKIESRLKLNDHVWLRQFQRVA